ncbi:MAG: CorA family divalent cation transporter, partial [Saprospiraceae bacterium]|nr:CorA family divalent cation transporter [Saprospiraceae bacterium]
MKKKKKTRQLIRNPGLPPGTLVFTGEKKVDASNVIMIQYSEEHLVEKSLKDDLPPPELNNFITWYDVKGLHNVSLIERLGQLYNIHSLILEDVLDTQQRPKFEEYEDGIFIILHAITFDRDTRETQTEHIAIFAGHNFLLSFQEKDDDTFAPVRERIRTASGRIRKRGSDYLAYALADSVVDHYFIVL